MEHRIDVHLEHYGSPQEQLALRSDCAIVADVADANSLHESRECRRVEPSYYYSGETSELLNHDPDLIPAPLVAPKRNVTNKRRHARIVCRNTKVCIESKDVTVIADVVDVSRGGVSFTTDEMWFPLFTPVLIAVHYIEGGHNVFQKAHIVRVRQRALAASVEYGVRFMDSDTPIMGKQTHKI